MKKIISISILFFIPFISLAQSVIKQHTPEKIKLKGLEKRKSDESKTLEVSQHTTSSENSSAKPGIVLGSKPYDLAKAEGKLAHYEIIHKPGKKTTVIKTEYKPGGTTTSSLTPCDIVPPGTTNPFPVDPTVDDQTYYDENGVYIQLPFTFCFYGNSYTEVNYSSNGNIQFPPTNNAAFSSVGFPAPNDQMIAPFWADLDNRGVGQYLIDVFPTYAVFTWTNCGYYNSHTDKTNSFQMVITDGLDPMLPPGKNVGFYYGSMQWTTGDASDGVNGFPDPAVTPAIPATVGMNAGNGIDYFLIGRFGQPGSFYDGPLGADDGVSWLDGKTFFFNACPPIGANNEPIPTLLGYCDTVRVCGNDTVYVKNTFIAPEVNQTVSVTATAPTLGSAFSYSVLPNTNSTDIYMIVDGSQATGGYHTITMTATDNGTPPQSAVQQMFIYVDQASVNNLNGTIVTTPTTGACPGAVITASVQVNGGAPGGYLWSNNATTSTTTYTTVMPADSLIFVTLTSGQCQKTIVGDININPVPVPVVLGNTSFCNGNASSTVLTVTNTLNPAAQAPYTYNWTGTGISGATNTETVNATGGTYTVTITNQFGCSATATTSVTMYESPSFTLSSTNAVQGGSVYCVNQDTARIFIGFGSGGAANCGLANSPCVTSNTFQVGTGTTNGSTTAYTPYNGIWESGKHQYIIPASELLAAGISAGKLNSLAFNVTNTNGNSTTFDNFSIKLKCVNYTSFPSSGSVVMDNVGLTQVYGPVTANTTVGWNTYSFTQPYLWDGTSNLLVDVCFFNPNWDGNISVQYTAMGYTASRVLYDDAVDQCPLNDDSNTNSATSVNRPNIIFGNCLAQQSGSQFNIAITPTLGVSIPAANDSIKIDLPSTPGTTCYTVTLTNPIGNCTKDTIICVQALQGITQGTLTASSYSVCPNQTLTLSAQGALTSYTIQYTDVNGPNSVVNNSVTITAPTAVGPYTYTLMATGPCGGPLTAFTNTINVLQGVTQATLDVSPVSVCPGNTITLSALGALSTYTILYTDQNGTTQSSVNTPVTFIASSTATPVFGTHTYTLMAEGLCNGPLTAFTNSVNVIQGTTQGTLAVSNATLCPGSSVTLNALGTLATYTIMYTDQNGTLQSSVNAPATFVPSSIAQPLFGIHTYTLMAEGPCSGPLTAFTNTLEVIQGVTNATLVATPSVVCIGSPVSLSSIGSLSTYTITYNNGSLINSVNNPVSFNSAVPGLNVYTLTAQGFCSAPINTYTASVQVNPKLNLSIAPMADITKCLNTSVTLTANVASSAAEPYTYLWTPAIGTNTNPTYTVTSNITNTYVVTVNGNCANTATASVVVSNFTDNLTVSILDSASVCANTEFSLNSNVSGGRPVYNYNWILFPASTIGNNTSSLSSVAPEVQGTYTVMLTVTDSCGYTDFTTQEITVLPPCDIVIPNVITANNDGKNDVFIVKNLEYHPNSVFTVFDRWGKKIYENSNYQNNWRAEGLNDGTYFYTLEVPDDKKYNGFIQVFKQ